MQNPKIYRQYAADCRRIAETMKARDRDVLMRMAETWEATAREAERLTVGDDP